MYGMNAQYSYGIVNFYVYYITTMILYRNYPIEFTITDYDGEYYSARVQMTYGKCPCFETKCKLDSTLPQEQIVECLWRDCLRSQVDAAIAEIETEKKLKECIPKLLDTELTYIFNKPIEVQDVDMIQEPPIKIQKISE